MFGFFKNEDNEENKQVISKDNYKDMEDLEDLVEELQSQINLNEITLKYAKDMIVKNEQDDVEIESIVGKILKIDINIDNDGDSTLIAMCISSKNKIFTIDIEGWTIKNFNISIDSLSNIEGKKISLLVINDWDEYLYEVC